MKNQHIYFLIMFLFIITSCSTKEMDEEINNTDIESKELLLHKIFRNGSLSNTFQYDEKNRIISNTYQTGIDSYSYIQDTIYGTLTTYNNEIINGSKRYSLDENSIRHDFFESTGELDYYRIYYYNSNPCGYSRRENYNEEGTLTSYSTVEYFDPNCGSMEIKMNSEDELVSIDTIHKTDIINAAFSIRLRPTMFDVEYEWKSRKIVDGEGNINQFGTFERTIITNSYNYPEKVISTTIAGSVTEYEYIYY